MMDGRLDWHARLMAASQSDKPRISVRTQHLRSLLAENQRLDAKAEHLLSDLRRHEMLLQDRDDLIAVLQDERTAAMNEVERGCQVGAAIQRQLEGARSERDALSKTLASTTSPGVRAAMLELLAFGALCFGAGATIHRYWFPLWW